MFSLAFMLVSSFAFANTNTAVTPKSETLRVASEKIVTYERYTPFTGKMLISVPESALNNNSICGFTVSWDIYGSTGSFWMSCDGATTIDDILTQIYALFF